MDHAAAAAYGNATTAAFINAVAGGVQRFACDKYDDPILNTSLDLLVLDFFSVVCK